MSDSPHRPPGFLGDVLRLMSGTTAAQLISLGVAPVLTRLYSPEAFGELALFMSLAALPGIIACLRYELAIPLPSRESDATALLRLVFAVCTVVSSLVALGILFFRTPLLNTLDTPGLAPVLFLIPAAVLLSGFKVSLTFWNSRQTRFGVIALAHFLGAMSIAAGKLGFGFFGTADGNHLVWSTLMGQFVTVLILGGGTVVSNHKRDPARRQLSRTWRMAGRYRKFPLVDSWSALLNNGSWQIPTLLFAAFFSEGVVGFYALSFRVIQLPMSFIGTSIGHVFYPAISRKHADGESIAPFMQELTQRLVQLGILPSLLLAVAGPSLFEFCFGARWETAGVYARILSPWFFVWFLAWPLCFVFGTLERQGVQLLYNVLIFITRLLSIAFGCFQGSPNLGLALYSGTGFLVYGAITLHALHLSQVSLRSLPRSLPREILPALGLVLPIAALQYTGTSSGWIFASSVGALAIYGIFQLATHPELRQWAREHCPPNPFFS